MTSVGDGSAALELVARGTLRPDLIITDYNLPGGMNGLEVAAKLRKELYAGLPVIVLTGDISTQTLCSIAAEDYVRLSKPVTATDLSEAVRSFVHISQATRPAAQPARDEARVIYIVDDDSHVREALRGAIEKAGRIVETYPTCEAFLEAYRPGHDGCLVIDARMPGMDGLALLHQLRASGDQIPAIMITGQGNVQVAIQAMKAGASDFIEKPFSNTELLASIDHALEHSEDIAKRNARRVNASEIIAGLTQREHQVMELILTGHPNKNIAADLGISQRTVEKHRAAIMHKTGAKSLPALARLALVAMPDDAGNSPDGTAEQQQHR